MVERITLVSDEVDDFILELKIDADATFYDLHKLILSSCRYEENRGNRFHICDENWEAEATIALDDTKTGGFDEETYLMKRTRLADFLEEEKQRFVYVFDPNNERTFFMELTETSFGAEQREPVCSRRHGQAPTQTLSDAPAQQTPEPVRHSDEIDENFYGNEDFDEEEFDPEGFAIETGDSYE